MLHDGFIAVAGTHVRYRMTDNLDGAQPDELLLATNESSGARRALHWYDFLCPFCYVGQQRNTIFASHGFDVVGLPFQAHPEIPPGGRAVGKRIGPMYGHIEEEARAAGLPLVWPDRLPNTRMALAAAEWTRRHAPQAFPALEKALFAAHFALSENLGDQNVIDRHAAAAGIDIAAMHEALDDGSAYALVDRSEALGKRLGVRGTPAWFVSGRLIAGLYPREHFDRLARDLAA
jgi:predicted DsbA family dithiol-disulfide isomerase